jgi:D-apionolactonase
MAEQRPSKSIALFGTDNPDEKGRVLRAGCLSVEFENGQLRYVRVGDTEVMRAVAFLVRDESWGTYATEISKLEIDESKDRFQIRYEGCCADGAVVYHADIRGEASELLFAARLSVTRKFSTNRTGFVILHPLEGCTGRPMDVEHVDGRIERSRFPSKISAYQPFFAIRALKHEFAPGAFITARLEGDTFEMEDQRNWSDASFKTYVRPIGLPWPYEIPAGKELKQSVSLRIDGSAPAQAHATSKDRVTVAIGERAGTMPQIGIEIPAKDAAASRETLKLVQALGPRLIVGKVLRHLGHGRREITTYREIAAACNAELAIEAALPCRDDPKQEAAELSEECAAAGAQVRSLTLWAAADLKGVLPGSAWPMQPPLEAIRWAALTAFPGSRIGGGAHAFFTELNRRRPLVHFLDYVSFTTTPIVHAADDRSVMETLETMPSIIESVAAIAGEKAWRIGPSSIGTRDNPYGSGPTPNPDNGRVCMTEIDPRQRGLFGAAWTVGYLATLAASGAEAIVLGTAVGPRGAIYRRMPEPQPWFDDVAGERIYPLFHVIKAAAAASGQEVLATTSSAPRRVAALVWRADRATRLLLANLTSETQRIDLSSVARKPTRYVVLDEAAFVTATSDPDWATRPGSLLGDHAIELPSYAVAFLTLGAGRG